MDWIKQIPQKKKPRVWLEYHALWCRCTNNLVEDIFYKLEQIGNTVFDQEFNAEKRLNSLTKGPKSKSSNQNQKQRRRSSSSRLWCSCLRQSYLSFPNPQLHPREDWPSWDQPLLTWTVRSWRWVITLGSWSEAVAPQVWQPLQLTSLGRTWWPTANTSTVPSFRLRNLGMSITARILFSLSTLFSRHFWGEFTKQDSNFCNETYSY